MSGLDTTFHDFRDGYVSSGHALVKDKLERLNHRFNCDALFSHYRKDQPGEMHSFHGLERQRKLHRCDTTRLWCCLGITDEIVDVSYMAKPIIGHNQIGLGEEEQELRRDRLLDTGLGDICRQLDSENRETRLDKMLQHIAIVSCNLNHEPVDTEVETRTHVPTIVPAMIQPAFGVRGKVRILTVSLVTRDIFCRSHEKAVATDLHPQGIGMLHGVELIRQNAGLAWWGHVQIHT